MITSTSSDRLTPDEPTATMFHYEPGHANATLQSLKNGQHSDITLKLDGISIPAHRCILMASSKYFAKKLSADEKVSELELVDYPSSGKAVIYNLICNIFRNNDLKLNLKVTTHDRNNAQLSGI